MKNLLLAIVTIIAFSLQAQTTYFITQTGAGTKDGSSWANAGDSNMVQSFIDAAAAGDNIWIAEGTYYPTTYPPNCDNCVDNRDYTFYLKSEVRIYGGFDGTEITLGDRDTILSTVFSGAINTSSDADNVYHVVVAINTGANTQLNGISIRYGYANGSSYVTLNSGAISIPPGPGGGILSLNSRLIVKHCNIEYNRAVGGAGVGSSDSQIGYDSCRFYYNRTMGSAGGGGIAADNLGSNTSMNHCVFISNQTGAYGGGAASLYGTANIQNCIFIGNSASSNEGSALNLFGNTGITNCVFSGNSGGPDIKASAFANVNVYFSTLSKGVNGIAIRAILNSVVTVRNSIIWNILTGYGAYSVGDQGSVSFNSCVVQGGQNGSSTPYFINANNVAGADGIYFTEDDGLALQCNSSARDRGVLSTNYTDITGYPRSVPQCEPGAYELHQPLITTTMVVNQIADVCEGTSATFVATPTNQGTNPVYQWRRNGSIVNGSTSDTLILTVNNGDIIRCRVTSSDLCARPDTAVQTVVAVVSSLQPTTVSISREPSFDCSQIIYSTTITNPGLNPVYQWKVNGNIVGSNAPTYTTSTYNDGDVVICELTSSASCHALVVAVDTLVLTGTAHHILYVKPNGTGDGTSWTNAFGSLQAALNAASECYTEIWVAAGTYKPSVRASFDLGPNPRRVTFELKNVAMYGGFNGTENSLAQRNIIANSTILSGDIGVSNYRNDNCFHVITSVNNSARAIVDGFTVRDGWANGYQGDSSVGGAVYTIGISPPIMIGSQAKFRNCTFTRNFASEGGACYIYQGYFVSQGLPGQEYENCIFSYDSCRNNTGDGSGGAVSSNYVGNKFYKCRFTNNTAGFSGGAFNGRADIHSCYFANNRARVGGALATNGRVYNSVIVHNVASKSGGGVYSEYSGGNVSFCTLYGNRSGGPFDHNQGAAICANTTVDGCIIWGNKNYQTPNAYAGYVNFVGKNIVDTVLTPSSTVIRQYPLFVDTSDIDGADNIPMTNDDGLRIACNSPAIDSGIVPSFGLVEDVVGNIRDTLPDIGAYEVSGAAPSISISSSNDSICPTLSLTFTATALSAGANPIYQWKKNGVNVGTNSATYTASGFAEGDRVYCTLTANTCGGAGIVFSDTVVVHLSSTLPTPVITANSSLAFCQGGQVVLSVSGSSNFMWSNGSNNNSITVTSSGTYAVSATSPNYCSAVSTPVTVTIHSLPNATITPSGGSATVCSGQSITLNATSGNTSYLWNTNATTPSITVNQGGTYRVTVTNANACTASSSIAVTSAQNVTPTVSLSASKTIICPGETVILTATTTNGGTNPSFVWRVNGVVSPGVNQSAVQASNVTDGTQFTVELTSSAPCAVPSQVTSSPITITISTPQIPTITATGNVLTSSVLSGNQWYLNGSLINGATSQTYTVSESGNYSVIATNEYGCVSSQSNTIPINVTGIESLTQESITISPNPASTTLNVSISREFLGAEFHIYDVTGKWIKSFVLQDENLNLDIENIESGTYIADVRWKGQGQKIKWIKL